MPQADTFKEFLVALGFKVDDNTLKKFNAGVEGATKVAAKLGVVTAAVIESTIAEIAAVSATMEKLYYVSQRTGSSVASIKGFDYAISNLGGSAEDAQASLENLGHFIRSYPGSTNFLEHLGVAPEHVKDSAAALKDLSNTFQHMPFWQAQPYANVLGIDEKTLLAMQNGDYNRYLDDYNRRLKESGVNAEEAAKDGHEFMVALRDIGSEVDVLSVKLEQKLAPWSTRRLREMGQLLTDMTNDPGRVGDTVSNGLPDYLRSISPSWMYPSNNGEANLSTWAGKMSGPSGDNRNNLDKRQNLVDYFTSQGWSQSSANGITDRLWAESKFDPGAKGDYVNGKPTAYGLFQAHKDWRGEFKKWAGHDIYGTSLEEQAEFINYALTQSTDRDARAAGKALKSAPSEQAAYAAFTNGFEKPSVRAPVINQTNSFNVTGSDPRSIASAVQARQNDVNNQLVRNIGGAVQ